MAKANLCPFKIARSKHTEAKKARKAALRTKAMHALIGLMSGDTPSGWTNESNGATGSYIVVRTKDGHRFDLSKHEAEIENKVTERKNAIAEKLAAEEKKAKDEADKKAQAEAEKTAQTVETGSVPAPETTPNA
jgi:hypothetical protein